MALQLALALEKAALVSVCPGDRLQLRWRLNSRATWRTRALSRFRSTISTTQA
jgi:hypothetical protein